MLLNLDHSNTDYYVKRLLLTSTFFIYKIKESKLCTFCKEHDELITHLFIECKMTNIFWKEVSELLNMPINLNVKTNIFNCVNPNSKMISNAIVLFGKVFIYRMRCQEKEVKILTFKNWLKEIEQIEKFIALSKDKLSLHTNKWEKIKMV